MTKRLQISLFLMRIGVFAVLFVWTLDKFLAPEHTARVWAKFYMIDNLGHTMSYAIGSIQMIIILAFLLGVLKRFSYGAVLIMHAASTISTWQYLINPYAGKGSLLFMTAVPMLAACIALYLLRDEDKLLTLSQK